MKTTNLSGKSPLHLACLSSSINKSKAFFILPHVQHVSQQGLFCQSGGIVSLLVANKVEADAVDLQGRTSLMHACQVSDAKIVDILLQAKSDSLKTDIDGMSALHFACLAPRKTGQFLKLLDFLPTLK